jgi:hypothetical protein
VEVAEGRRAARRPSQEVTLPDREDLQAPHEVGRRLRGPSGVARDLGPGRRLGEVRPLGHEAWHLLEGHVAGVEARVDDDSRCAEQHRLDLIEL